MTKMHLILIFIPLTSLSYQSSVTGNR
jgi:hypothetical protein